MCTDECQKKMLEIVALNVIKDPFIIAFNGNLFMISALLTLNSPCVGLLDFGLSCMLEKSVRTAWIRTLASFQVALGQSCLLNHIRGSLPRRSFSVQICSS